MFGVRGCGVCCCCAGQLRLLLCGCSACHCDSSHTSVALQHVARSVRSALARVLQGCQCLHPQELSSRRCSSALEPLECYKAAFGLLSSIWHAHRRVRGQNASGRQAWTLQMLRCAQGTGGARSSSKNAVPSTAHSTSQCCDARSRSFDHACGGPRRVSVRAPRRIIFAGLPGAVGCPF